MWIVAGMVPKNSDVLTFGTTPTLAFGDGITDPSGGARPRRVLWRSRQLRQAARRPPERSWTPDMGVFKGLDAGVAYSQREVEPSPGSADSWNAFSGYHVRCRRRCSR
jgi:iron complex outermembrane receptor protein